ncbi:MULTISPECIES: replicative DNA helicase [Dasania]|nr:MULTISPECIES: replicative DNA helicase [Dasania]
MSSPPPGMGDDVDLAALKVPPHSIEAEQSVLGGLMIANEAWDNVADQLKPEDFYRGAHKQIFRQMVALVDAENPIDVITLSEALNNTGELEQVGGLAYLAELAKNTPSAANIRAYATVVRERASLRSLINVANEIVESGYSPEGRSSDELLDEAERNIMKIGEERPKEGGPQGVNPLLQLTLERIDEMSTADGGITGVTTGFAKLDEMTSGLQASDLIIVAARPSMGKTTFAMNLVENALFGSEKPVLVFSMEMPADAIVMRMISSVGRINQTHVRTGQLSEEEWPKLAAAITKLKDKPLFIDDTAALTPTEVRARARRLVREHGDLGLIMIDYLQLMRVAGNNEGRTAEISEISRSLKSIAKEFQCPVVALSQLNRSLEQRPNKRPINSDLRESGAIEQDADVIMFIYRDEVYNEDTTDKGVGEIIIGKQRNGPIGYCKLAFIGQYTRFENLSHYDDEDAY